MALCELTVKCIQRYIIICTGLSNVYPLHRQGMVPHAVLKWYQMNSNSLNNIVTYTYHHADFKICLLQHNYTQITKFMGPTWDPPGSCRPPDGPHVGPMNLAIRVSTKLVGNGRNQDFRTWMYDYIPQKFVGFMSDHALVSYRLLTHWGRDKMDAISQTTLSSAFSWKKSQNFD